MAPLINTEAAMQAVARQQVEYHRVKHPGRAIGGELMLAEILSKEISIRRIATLTEDDVCPFDLKDDLDGSMAKEIASWKKAT